jgi:hypothetical protein
MRAWPRRVLLYDSGTLSCSPHSYMVAKTEYGTAAEKKNIRHPSSMALIRRCRPAPAVAAFRTSLTLRRGAGVCAQKQSRRAERRASGRLLRSGLGGAGGGAGSLLGGLRGVGGGSVRGRGGAWSII